MAEENKFEFCPLCGALARNSVCQSCGFTMQNVQQPMNNSQPMQNMGQSVYGQPMQNMGQPVYGQPMQNMGQPVYGQSVQNMGQPVYGQPVQNMGQPMYTGQPVYGQPDFYAVPPAQPPKKNHLWIVILVLCMVLLLTVAAIFIGVNSIMNHSEDATVEEAMGDGNEEESSGNGETVSAESGDAEDNSGENDADEPVINLEDYEHEIYDMTDHNLAEEGQDTSLTYYSGPYNAIDESLSYEVSFTYELFYSDKEPVYIAIEYPQITGGLEEQSEFINEILRYEYEYYVTLFTDEFTSIRESENDSYHCYVESYITYMDEDILSVVFKEELYTSLGDDMFGSMDFYCVNIDLQNQKVMDNTEILLLDEGFAADFRQREIMENGDQALTEFTDAQILEMLKDSSQLVIFYTPYGMEVGLNLEDIIVYVMYDDYTKFLND